MMHFPTILKSIPLAVTLCATAGAALSDEFRQITTEAEFREMIVGKKLWLNDNYAISRKNGRVSGKFNGKTLKGAWEWREEYWCRTLTTVSPGTDCQTWEADHAGKFRVTRARGTGKTFTYELR